jgi:hypothetical protein
MFEEHEAALDYGRVEAWIRVYAGIVDFLNKTEPSAVVAPALMSTAGDTRLRSSSLTLDSKTRLRSTSRTFKSIRVSRMNGCLSTTFPFGNVLRNKTNWPVKLCQDTYFQRSAWP